MTANLTSSVAETIKLKIISGEYAAREKLPNEQALSLELGVSRTTIREAIKILVSKNIVTIKRGQGTYVNDEPGIADDPFGFEFLPPEVVLKNLREMRYYVDPIVSRLAARNANKKQLRSMGGIVENMQTASSVAQSSELFLDAVAKFSNYELLFHSLIYEMSNNIVFMRLQLVVMKSVHSFYYKYLAAANYNLKDAFECHRNIYYAIRAHDEDAAYRYTKEHMFDP